MIVKESAPPFPNLVDGAEVSLDGRKPTTARSAARECVRRSQSGFVQVSLC